MASKPNAARKIMYVNKVATDGWLTVLLRDTNTTTSIVEYTKIEILEVKGGRTYFLIKDGRAKDKVASLKDANASEFLGSTAPLQTGVSVLVRYGAVKEVYSVTKAVKLVQQTATLSVNGIQATVTLNTKLAPPFHTFTPLPPGVYRIGTPKAPHDRRMTMPYIQTEPALAHDAIWFPIEYGNNSRFIHIGNISEGCVTVMDLKKWNAIYRVLISHRVAGSEYVGQLAIAR